MSVFDKEKTFWKKTKVFYNNIFDTFTIKRVYQIGFSKNVRLYQKEKPKPNRDIQSILNEITKSKHKNNGKQMKDDDKDRLSL